MTQQVSYGTITIIDTNDIESIVVEYNRNQSSSTPPAQDDSGWSTNRPAWAQNYYIWQRTRTHRSGTATTEDDFGTAVCITGTPGQTGSAGQSLTNTKTQYTHVASNVTITTNNHTSYTWTDNVPSYSASAPVYWGRITNTYSNPSDTKYIVYKDNGLTDAIAKSVEANANAAAANSNATEALNKAKNSIVSTVQLWYQTSSNTKPNVPTAHSQVDSGTNTYNNWRSIRPTNNVSTYPYYYYCYEYKHGDNTYTYSNEAILDTSNLSQYQIEALDTKLKAFFYPGDSNNPGAYAVANGESDGLDVTDISTYGYNVGIRPTNISIGYDNTPVIQLDGSSSTGALKLYRFPTISQGTVTQAGTLGMSLGTSNLIFYNPNGSTESAILNTNGLKIRQGGLEAGDFNTNDYVYAWSTDRSDRSLAINDSGNKTDWRFLAGKKFGVDKAGNLYASNVNVSGKIKVGEGSNVYTTDNVNPLQIGGRNLLLATPKEHNATAYRIYQLPLSENLIVGETYTLQFWGVSLDSNSTGLRPFWGGGNNVLTPLTKPNSSGYWAQTFTVGTPSSSTEAANKWLAIYNAPSGHNGANGSISKWKLEKGNKATDWTPAPEDTIHDNLVNGSQKMDGWKRNSNASLDTSSEFGDVTLTGSSSNWLGGILTAPTIRTSILDGSALWLSLEYKASTASTLHIEFSGTASNPDTSPGSQTKYKTWNYSVASTSSWTKLAYPMPTLLSELTGGSGNVNSLFVAFYNRTDNSTMHIRKVKLEHGLAQTEWTPSPEDFKTFITRIDDAGIFISPSNQSPTDSSKGNSVKINGDGFYIYQGGAEKAYFKASAVAIGEAGKGRAVIQDSGLYIYDYANDTQSSVAFFGETARVGKSGSQRVELTSSAVDIYDSGNKLATRMDTNGLTIYKQGSKRAATTANGLDIFGSNGSTNVASFGATTRIGATTVGNKYVFIASSGFYVTKQVDASTTKDYLTITDSWFCMGDPSATRITMSVTGDNPYIYMNANGHNAFQADASGVHLYDTDGKERATVNANGLTIKNASGNTKASYSDDINLYGGGGTYPLVRIRTSDGITLAQSANNRTVITSGGMYIYTNNVERAYFTDSAVAVGTTGRGRVILKDDGLHVYNYSGSSQYDVGFFGDTARIGKSGSQRIEANSSGIEIYDSGSVRRLLLNASTGLVIGRSDKQHITINDANINIYNSSDGTTLMAQFGSTITLGNTGTNKPNVRIYTTDTTSSGAPMAGIDCRIGSTILFSIQAWDENKSFYIGNSTYHLESSSSGLYCNKSFSSGSYVESSTSNGQVRLAVDSSHRGLYDAGNSKWIIYGGASNYNYVNDHLGPGTNSTSTSTGYYLGWSAYRWRGVYSYSAPNSVSDRKEKDIIGSIDYAKELIMKLKPIEYQWKNSDHNRIHLGLIAQDVAKIGKELNKNLSIYEANYKNSEQKYHGEEVDDNELSWGMTYTELIAPMIKVIQEQEQRIQKLESIIKGGNVDVSD